MKVIYTRVSTGKQETENQAEQLREFAAKQGWTIRDGHEFTDVVKGRKSERDRPNFKRMFDAASRRKFDLVLFWALDRFSREGVLPTFHHLQRLDGYGVEFPHRAVPRLQGRLQGRGDLDHGDHRQAGTHPQVGARQGGTGACQTPRF